MIFAKPLFLLLIFPVLALFYWRRRQKMTAAIRFPSVKGFQVIAATRAQFLFMMPTQHNSLRGTAHMIIDPQAAGFCPNKLDRLNHF